MPRISSETDLREINRQLEQITTVRKQLESLSQKVGNQSAQLKQVDIVHAPATTNNLLFTWTGSTLTLSWPAGSVRDKNGANRPVAAGSIGNLTASTYYWLSWNPVHQVMSAQISAESSLENPGNIVICQLFTGTAGQTGTAGGGKSSGHSDLSGSRYKLF